MIQVDDMDPSPSMTTPKNCSETVDIAAYLAEPVRNGEDLGIGQERPEQI